MFFILLLIVSFFQLQGMEEKRLIDLNDIPTDVINAYVLPTILPELFFGINSKNIDSNKNDVYDSATILYYSMLSNDDTFKKKLCSIALINKRFFTIIQFHYNSYNACINRLNTINNTSDSSTTFSLVDLSNYFKFPIVKLLTFKQKTKLLNIGKKESMKLEINFSPVKTTEGKNKICFLMNFIFSTSKTFTFKKVNYFYYIDNDNIQESTDFNLLCEFFDFLNKNAKSSFYNSSTMDGADDINEIGFEYYFDCTQTISKENALLLCTFLKQINLPSPKRAKIGFVENLKTFFKKK
ncbi:MAG TPA: hypothetical protein VL201_00605 [Patescibacteria group bacterium]|jgi:hypothetical protein|nr:hypothetical protein [Patescibacteria group bacterium]